MRRLAIGSGLGLLLWASASLAAAPDWAARPAGQAIGPAYPAIARQLGIEGAARLACKVGLDGSATDCTVAWESPSGLGFGAAALALAPSFKLKPGAVEGAAVEIPVQFKPWSTVSPAPTDTAAAPPAPAALAAARRILTVQGTEHYLEQRYAQLILGLTDGPQDGASPKALELARAALMTAAGDAITRNLEAATVIYASGQSLEALEANAAFSESKPGVAYRAITPKIGAYEDALLRDQVRRLVIALQCQEPSCPTPARPAPLSPVPVPQPTPAALKAAQAIAAIDARGGPPSAAGLKAMFGGGATLSDADFQRLIDGEWARYQTSIAEAYSGLLDEAQLRAVLEFKSSPAASAMRENGDAKAKALQRLELESMRGALRAAAKAFCAQRSCELAAAPASKAPELEPLVITTSPYGL